MCTSSPQLRILDSFNDAIRYSDGPSEDALLHLFSQENDSDIKESVHQILANAPSWQERVHLSPQRLNLLNWYPFSPDARLLEIGAGCGALTGLFCEKVATVDTLDLSLQRSQILVQRHRRQTNLRSFVGTLHQFKSKGNTYDYIICIGVLEYAGRYVESSGDAHAPYRIFLRDVAQLLVSGGRLLLAIENQFGSKYLSGGAEDHYGKIHEGVEDYPHYTGMRTFGKVELESLIQSAGMSVRTWYYPSPDYKLPHTVYSDDVPPGSIQHVAQLYPTPDYAYPRAFYFNETRFMNAARRNKLETVFANSFLVECTR